MVNRIVGDSPSLVRPNESAGGQVGFLHRERIEVADFPNWSTKSIIASDRNGAWSTKKVIIFLARPGSVHLKYSLSSTDDGHNSEDDEYISSEDKATHLFEIDNYWELIRLVGVSTSQPITGIKISA